MQWNKTLLPGCAHSHTPLLAHTKKTRQYEFAGTLPYSDDSGYFIRASRTGYFLHQEMSPLAAVLTCRAVSSYLLET
ncbi:Uncharacterised protein [Yokenella regensburgei]|nr:Uncharacterised protein [Yokenella regensburgei]